MFILSYVLTFVLGCTLALLWKWLRDIRNDIRCDIIVLKVRTNRLNSMRAVRNDDTLTPTEKYYESLRY